METLTEQLTATSLGDQSNRESAFRECGEYKHTTDSSTEDAGKNSTAVNGPGCNRDEEPISKDNIENVTLEIEELKNDPLKFTGNTESSSPTVGDTLKQGKAKLRIYTSNCGCLCTFVLGISTLLLAYTTVKLVLGSLYLKSCKLKPQIPIFLVVDASAALVYFAMPLLYWRCPKQDDVRHKAGQWTFPVLLKAGCGITLILFVFHIAWLIFGTVIIVQTRSSIYRDDHCRNETNSEPIPDCVTCDEALADFTLIIVAVQWVIVGLVIVVAGLFASCVLWSALSKK